MGAEIEIVMPAMGESVTEGTILEWHKQPGDTVEGDEVIVEISTDKVDIEVPAPASGTITELLVDVGDTVAVGQPLARMLAGESAAPRPDAPPSDGGTAQAKPAPAPPAGDGNGAAGRASPVARRAADIHGVDLEQVVGSGPAGRVTKSDVLAAAGNGDAAARRRPPRRHPPPRKHRQAPS